MHPAFVFSFTVCLFSGCDQRPPSSKEIGLEASTAEIRATSQSAFGIGARFENSARCEIEIEPSPPSGWSSPVAYDVEVIGSGNAGLEVGTRLRVVLLSATAVPVEDEALLFYLPHTSSLGGNCDGAVAGRRDYGFTEAFEGALPGLSFDDAVATIAQVENTSDELIAPSNYANE